MTLSFNIVEQKQVDYDAVKQDYLNGIIGMELREKHGLGGSAYLRLLKRFREEGIPVPNKSPKKSRKCKYYYREFKRGKPYWSVRKWINGEVVWFGGYWTEAEAKQRVKELRENNWEGLLK